MINNNKIMELEKQIEKVEQTLSSVKNFENLRKGSRLEYKSYAGGYTYEYVVSYSYSINFSLVNIETGNFWESGGKDLDLIKKDLRDCQYGDFRLIGDPLISDLEDQLKNLRIMLEDASKPKVLKVSDAPDGWYTISGVGSMNGNSTNPEIQKGDVIFIKEETVFMKDHGRFTNEYTQLDYSIKGIHKNCWSWYNVEKLP